MQNLINDYKKLLSEYISIKSIGADSSYFDETLKAVKWLSDLFKSHGFKVQTIKGSKSNPVIFAEYSNGSKETFLIYGHYDVQPAEENQGWKTKPFEMSEKNGYLYGRGVLDDKGQVLIHIMSIFKLIENRNLGFNIKFLIEGNEESGNEDMQKLLKDNKNLLKSDYVLISDGEVYKNTPLIEASLRGAFGMKIVVKTGNTDLHSGLYGGAVLNAGTVISNLLSKIVDSKNNVLIPCFDNGVDKITTEQLVNVNKMETPEVKSLTLNQGEKFFSKIALMPTIQITGIKLGYTGEGFNNIVPGEAEARINIRTVSSQDGNIIEELIRNFITENLPTGIECEITSGGKYNPVKLNTDSKMHNRARLSLKKAFGINPLLKYVGGSLPFVTDIKKIYGIDTILVPLGSDNSNAHGPNENYSLDIIEKGFAFSLDFFKK